MVRPSSTVRPTPSRGPVPRPKVHPQSRESASPPRESAFPRSLGHRPAISRRGRPSQPGASPVLKSKARGPDLLHLERESKLFWEVGGSW
ncbi:unnamed protein product [Rangifer tarandus platyrhynchus]|uniref:Uncharacterized protein n=2 Tax=Rangifer tarandus platyrhynchus TaxID=3082113 RepID=A0ACB0FAJ8_RANTA|nr:unnamed protein product [Rangifer tarandus platyrhynchus]CAI9709111.1 unnamed protein product [Rangifer tarandus platyrhynchus]